MRFTAILLLVAACGDNRHRDAPDASVDATIPDAPPDTGPCAHGEATTPVTIHGRSFATFQRAGAVMVFAGDPWPAIVIEAGPIARCACDAPPAGGVGNTLITVITDWPIQAGPAEIIGVYMHEDTSTSPIGGGGSMAFTQVTPTSASGTMTVQFPGDPGPVDIAFDAPNCNTYQ
jgi:hypothetical protein